MHIYFKVFNEKKSYFKFKNTFIWIKNQQNGFEEREKYEKITIN